MNKFENFVIQSEINGNNINQKDMVEDTFASMKSSFEIKAIKQIDKDFKYFNENVRRTITDETENQKTKDSQARIDQLIKECNTIQNKYKKLKTKYIEL